MRNLLLLLLTTGIVLSAFAGFSKVGTTAVPFLKIGVGRSTGMGDAFVAIADDASSVYWNPAGLTNLKTREFFFSHIAWIAGINHDYISAVFPVTGLGTLGLSVTALTMGNFEETQVDDPTTDRREDDGTGRTFTASDFTLGFTFSRMITDKLSFGFTAKGIQERLWMMGSTGIGVDVGLFYNTGFRSLRLGMCISNFGPDMTVTGGQLIFPSPLPGQDTSKTTNVTMNATSAPLPSLFRFGAAYNIIETGSSVLTAALDVVHPNDINETVNVGFEYGLNKLFYLRGGYILNMDFEYAKALNWITGLSAGTGVSVKPTPNLRLKIDYTYRYQGYLKSTHRVMLSLGF
jgi:opacity protein-like surface antigen